MSSQRRILRFVALRSVGILCLACVLQNSMGCEGVGRPLVDSTTGGRDSNPMSAMCPESPECLPAEISRRPRAKIRKGPIDLDTCATMGVSVIAAPRIECAEVAWSEADLSESIPPGLVLSNSNLTISVTRPTTLTLDTAELTNVWLSLRGPVKLRLGAQSTLSRVHVELFHEQGSPSLEVGDTSLTSVAIEGARESSMASATFTRARLSNVELSLPQTQLRSVWATQLIVDGPELDVVDLEASETDLTFDRATLAASSLTSTRILRCGSLSLARSSLEGSSLVACSDGPARVYDSSIIESLVDGAIDSDMSMWSAVIFGGREATELNAWDSLFGSVSFCAKTFDLRFAGLSSIACSVCEGREESAVSCERDRDKVQSEGNRCPALEALEVCGDGFPRRERPKD